MSKDTGIAWTDHTFNPFWGCTKVSPGCDHCYAETVDAKFSADPHWGKGVPRKVFGDAHWNEPLKWQKAAEKAGRIDKVFCASMADVMDDEAPEGQRERLWEVVNKTPNLLWQLLTKRPHRYGTYLPENGFKYDNVILGATAENQEFYVARIFKLAVAKMNLTAANRRQDQTRSQVQSFISYEPALGPITMRNLPVPNWLIFGGETGEGRRPMDIAWAENIKAECEEFGVKFFMKQMSAFRPATAAKLIPAHLLVRQFPELA